MPASHINFLELLAAFLTLQHFLSLLRGYHVLVRMNNTAKVVHTIRGACIPLSCTWGYEHGVRFYSLHGIDVDTLVHVWPCMLAGGDFPAAMGQAVAESLNRAAPARCGFYHTERSTWSSYNYKWTWFKE